jgi:hypothetical protein
MAFKNMMNGDDSCGGANPMAQMLKQFGQDRSLQRVSITNKIKNSINCLLIEPIRINLLDLLNKMLDLHR